MDRLALSGHRVTVSQVNTSADSDSGTTSTAHEPSRQPVFVTTRWSMVLTAGRSDSTRARTALNKLCQAYWHPLYAFVRQRGYSPPDAQDLTQEFFARLLEREALAKADPLKGRFRSFLLGSLKHFLAHEWEKARAQKRGGRVHFVPLASDTAETRYAAQPANDDTPDKAFDRRWAVALLDVVLGRLRQEYADAGRDDVFLRLKETLSGGRGATPYRELAELLGMSESAIKVAAHRMRRRYRELLREEIAQTVAAPGEVEEELRHLFAALGA